MSATATDTITCESAEASTRQTRIDGPHEVSHEQAASSVPDAPGVASQTLLEIADEPSPNLLAAVAGETLDSRREQLQLQVSQLAGHLRERLREVDRREAAVNARASQLEADLRANRIWLREREHDFSEREAELRRQIEELQGRTAAAGEPAPSHLTRLVGVGPGVTEQTIDDPASRRQELAEREHRLQLREHELQDRQFEFERIAALERKRLETEFRERISQRENELASAEALLAEHAALIDQDRAALDADRAGWHEQKTRQQQELDQRRQLCEAEHADRTQSLDARQDWIERQKAGLDQVRSEVLGLHRQSLEMRLIAEQLWAQITGRLTPAEVTHAVAQLRLKLTEQYRLEEQNLDARRQELVTLGERLAQQHEELVQLKSGLREWAAARQEEVEQQAADLVRRELALDEQEERNRQSQHTWQADRRRLEQQIRELTSQLRTASAA